MAFGRTVVAALILALPFAGCSSGLNFTSPFNLSAAAPTADDDSKCQSSGYTYGTPEYDQCRQALVQQRAEPDRAEVPRVYYPSAF